MKKSATDKLPHFHPELLAEAAGPKVYRRGVAYHAEGQVATKLGVSLRTDSSNKPTKRKVQ